MTGASRVLPAVLLALIVLGACGPAPTQPPGPAPTDPPTTGEPATPGDSTGPAGPIVLDPATPWACYGLSERDCARALEAAAAGLGAGDVPVVYAQVGPFGCRAGEGCESSLVARPSGSVTFELAGGDPIEMLVELMADGTFNVERGQAVTVRLDPSSAPVEPSGIIPFSLGHCGLGSGIDVDGSWWDPIGFVDSDHGDAINAADGTLAPTGINRATFTSANGLVVMLARRVGPKHLPLCM